MLGLGAFPSLYININNYLKQCKYIKIFFYEQVITSFFFCYADGIFKAK